jgi:pimeloyl-ACP methyl ester carboxylesterase
VVEHGLASVRLDYSGVGDSPGRVDSWALSDVAAAAQQALTVLTTASELLDVSRFALVGTCYGSRVALNLVTQPTCLGAICLAPPVLEHGGVTNFGRRLGHRRGLSFVRSNPVFRRLVYEPLRAALKESKPAPTVVGALRGLDHAELVFLYSDNYERDHFNEATRQALEEAVSKLPADQRARFALHVLSTGALTTFEVLPPDEQDAIMDRFLPSLYEWFDRDVTDAAPSRLPATEPVS